MLAGEGLMVILCWWSSAGHWFVVTPDTALSSISPQSTLHLYIYILCISSRVFQLLTGEARAACACVRVTRPPAETSGDHGASVPTLQLGARCQVPRLTTAWHNSLLPGSGLEPRKLWFISANVWLQLGLCCSKLGPRWRNFNSWLPRTEQCIQATSYKLILAVCDPFIWALSGLLPPWTLRM